MRTHQLCIAVLAVVVGCDDSGDDREQAALDRGEARGEELASQARDTVATASEPDALAIAAGIVSTINVGEIEQANIILSTSTNEDVRQLASEIQIDHQSNEVELQALLAERGLAPIETNVSLTLEEEAMTGLAQLDEEDNSDDRDLAYVDMQIAMHQEAFMTVEALRDEMDDSEMQNFLETTADSISEHRDHAGSMIDDL